MPEGEETQIHARVLACGDTAVTLELSDRIDEAINSKSYRTRSRSCDAATRRREGDHTNISFSDGRL